MKANIIDNWLKENTNPEIDKQVENEYKEIMSKEAKDKEPLTWINKLNKIFLTILILSLLLIIGIIIAILFEENDFFVRFLISIPFSTYSVFLIKRIWTINNQRSR